MIPFDKTTSAATYAGSGIAIFGGINAATGQPGVIVIDEYVLTAV